MLALVCGKHENDRFGLTGCKDQHSGVICSPHCDCDVLQSQFKEASESVRLDSLLPSCEYSG